MKKYKSLEELFKELGLSESSGRYNVVNSAGYLGKYQMGGSALTDAGYYKLNPNGKENDWLGTFTGKDNVNSKEDFLNNPYAQENAIREFTKKQWGYLKNNGSTKSVGSKINGIEITPSGLLAAAHLVGQGGVGSYVSSNGKNIPKDGNGVSIEKYLKQFAGYDVSEISDSNYYSPRFPQTKEEKVDQILNKTSNMIQDVTKKVNPPTQTIPDNVINERNLININGLEIEKLLKVYKWIWGQEDCNYPNAEGRWLSMNAILSEFNLKKDYFKKGGQ